MPRAPAGTKGRSGGWNFKPTHYPTTREFKLTRYPARATRHPAQTPPALPVKPPSGTTLAEAKVCTVLSTAPYSRKIERGEFSQARECVYEAVAVLAQRRFGNIASIGFEYRSPMSAYVAGGANRAERAALRSQPARLAAMRQERETRVPSITVTT